MYYISPVFGFAPSPLDYDTTRDRRAVSRVQLGAHFEVAVGAPGPSPGQIEKARAAGFDIRETRHDSRAAKDYKKNRLNIGVDRAGTVAKLYFG